VSFSVVTKNELARVTAARECCRLAELAALVKMDGTLQLSSGRRANLHIVTENAAVARKIFVLFKEIFGVHTEVLVSKKVRLRKNNVYLVRIAPREGAAGILERLGMLDGEGNLLESMLEDLVRRDCCRRSYLRGAFLGGGSVNSPKGAYHLEIVTNNQRHAKDLARLMKKFDLAAKISYRKKWHVVYLKESEQIVSCLNIMGAHTALLNFENIRIFKDMRNHVNRLVNCETANLNKTVNASVRQIDSIQVIARSIGLNKLPPSLREMAALRLKNPDASLKELGELMQPPVGKSGVNHRLRKLEKIAEKMRP
jgi:DNA-binding protein WhiA